MRARLTESVAGISGALVQNDGAVRVLPVNTLSMRGAQRQITAHLIAEGYAPGGRWRIDPTDPSATERSFAAMEQVP